MRVIGLVGGIGSGKSEAAKALAALGALVIDADRVGHAVYAPGTRGFDAVVAEFGGDIVGADGRIDRKRLAARVFPEPAALERLNAIVHPLIRQDIASRIDEARSSAGFPAVVVEAAILLEAGWRSLVDEVWAVVSSPDRVRERMVAHRGLAPAEIEARAARQMPDAERRQAADMVIENEGSLEDLRGRLAELWRSRIAR